MTEPHDASVESPEYLIYGQVAEEVKACLGAGRLPDVEALAARHPNLAGQIRQLVPTLLIVQQLRQEETPPDPLAAVPQAAGGAGRLGDYRIVREVGRGGMGIVYEAEQLSLKRKVALKVLPLAAAMDAKQLQRFQHEAEAAAHLHHTNIVPVYAVGCERGIHYYAMQFIDGHTLAQIIGELRRPTPSEPRPSGSGGNAAPLPDGRGSDTAAAVLTTERAARDLVFFRRVAELGAQAAEALEHAHQLGVVHRDVKPANLLVDGRGQLWVTDFGLARMQGETGLTLSGDVVGTLRYMSPEQALAKRGLVDHRTDIYALGATLYELLALAPVFDGKDRQELLGQIAYDEPRPLRRLNPAVPTDLETVVHKALAKEVEGRYATAQELADDLRRFLDDKPIRARRPTLWERARRWLRRHQGLAAATVVVLAVAVVALAVSTALVARQRDVAEANQKEAAAQRRRAEENLRLALKAMDDIVLPVLLDRLPGDARLEQEAQALLQKAREFYREFVTNNRDTPSLRPELASAYQSLAHLHRRLRQDTEAEAAYRAAAALWAELREEFPDRPEYRQALVGNCWGLGALLERTRRLPEAEKVLLQARDLCQELVAAFPQNDEYQHNLGGSYLDLARTLRVSGRVHDALAASRQALDIHSRRAAPPDDPKTRGMILYSLAMSHLDQGILFEAVGQPQQAEKDLRRAVDLFPEVLKQSPKSFYARKHLTDAKQYLGRLLASEARMAQAEEWFDQARDEYQRLFHDFPNVPIYRGLLAENQRQRAMFLMALDRLPEAEEALRHALQLVQPLADGSPAAPEYRQDLAKCQFCLAEVLAVTGREAAAERAYGQAGALYEGLVQEFPEVPDYRNELAMNCEQLGLLLTKTGRPEEAERLFGRSLTLRRQFEGHVAGLPLYRRNLARTSTYLGNLLKAGRRFEEAEQAYRQALAMEQELVDQYPRNPLYRSNLAGTLKGLAGLWRDRGDLRQACQFLEQVIHHEQTILELHRHLGDASKVLPRRDAHRLVHSCLDLAALFQRLGDHARLAKVAAQLPPLFPDSWQMHVHAATLLAQCVPLAEHDARLIEAERPAVVQKYVEQARQQVRDVLARGGDNPEAQNAAAWLLAAAPAPPVRDAGRALELAQQAVRRAPVVSRFWITLAAAHHRAGDAQAAQAALETAALLHPGGVGVAWSFLALAHLATTP